MRMVVRLSTLVTVLFLAACGGGGGGGGGAPATARAQPRQRLQTLASWW